MFSRNFNIIFSSFISYLPSRFLVVLNAVVIIPVLAHLMSVNEMGIFQLCIGILNLVCTCSSDWIAKSALRFYEKYKVIGHLDEFFSNTILISLFVYALILVLYFGFGHFICNKLFIPHKVLLLTLILVIPVGIRQFLYQMLRVFDRPFLYMFSIVIYQISLIALFLLYSNVIPNIYAIVLAMLTAVCLIDFYIINVIRLKIDFKPKPDKAILFETLKYALPLIITNTSIWAVLNINKFVFQYNEMFHDTAVAGVSWLFTTSVLTPLFSTFLFAIFPAIIKKFEEQNRIKPLVTNTIQLYCALFIPVVVFFCGFSKDIANFAFSGKYNDACILISFFAVSLFFHELMKLFNVKYHLKNKTYIEMALSCLTGLLCLNLNFFLIPEFGLLGAGVSMLFSVLILFFANLIIQFMDYVSYLRIAKTALFSLILSLAVYLCVQIFQDFVFVKMLLFVFFTYFISALAAKKIFT